MCCCVFDIYLYVYHISQMPLKDAPNIACLFADSTGVLLEYIISSILVRDEKVTRCIPALL